MKPDQLTDERIVKFALAFLKANLNSETAATLLKREQPCSEKVVGQVAERLQKTGTLTFQGAAISYADGENAYVAFTQKQLEAELYDYICDWWEAEEIPGRIPKNHHRAIWRYFNYMQERSAGEYITYQQVFLRVDTE